MIVKRRTRFKNGFSTETVVFAGSSLFYLSVLAAADVEIDGILADAQRLGTFYNAVFQFEKPFAVEPPSCDGLSAKFSSRPTLAPSSVFISVFITEASGVFR